MSDCSIDSADICYLVGDIGGTNLRLQLIDSQGVLVKKLLKKTAEFGCLDEAFDELLQDSQVSNSQIMAAISIASKIVDNKAITRANFSWHLPDGQALKKKYNFKGMRMLNDFEACGYSLPTLEAKRLIRLKGPAQESFKSRELKIMLVGPGTGLGVCLFDRKDGKEVVLSSEGGHISLSSFDEVQFEYQEFAKKRLGLSKYELISAEALFCGRGIPNLYEFHSLREGITPQRKMLGEEIFAKIDSDPIAKKAFEHFLRMLGTCLSHLASAFLPDDGIYLSGTILSSVVKHLQKDVENPETSHLITSFENNSCLAPYLKQIPILFSPEPNLGIKGCLNLLQTKTN